MIMVAVGVLMIVATVLAVLGTVARYRHNVAPNSVAIVSGRSRKAGDSKVGYRVVAGGGFFLIPVLERVDYLSLNMMAFDVSVEDAPDKNGAPVSVRAIANVKILSTAEALPLAIERFLGTTMQAVQQFAKENLESNLRAIVGTLTIEDLIKDRSALQSSVATEAVQDLAKLGLGVDLFNVQEVRDSRGYIEALGQTQTAAVKRDAAIGKAEAERDAKVRATAATREGEIAAAQATQAISDASRDRDIVVAQNAARTQAEQAKIKIAAEIAAAEQTSILNVANVSAEMAKVKAQTDLQVLERQRREAELQATVILTAERQRDARLIAADAEQQAASKEGEAYRIKAMKQAEGELAKASAEAQGRKQTAAAYQAELEAQAAGEKAKLLAHAEGSRAQALAEAAGVEARLMAEARGAEKKAEAFRQLDEAGRFLMIMEASPEAIRAIGTAVSDALKPVSDAIGQGLGNIESVRVVDLGGAASNGAALKSIANMPLETMTQLAAKAQALGFMPLLQQMAGKFGLDLDSDSQSAAE